MDDNAGTPPADIDAQVQDQGMGSPPIDPQSPVPATNSDMPMGTPQQGMPPSTDPLMTGGIQKKQISFMTKDGKQVNFQAIPGLKKAYMKFMKKS